jgi:hypothetical protein
MISVLEVGDGVFEVLSTSGDTHLGGDDFDKVSHSLDRKCIFFPFFLGLQLSSSFSFLFGYMLAHNKISSVLHEVIFVFSDVSSVTELH